MGHLQENFARIFATNPATPCQRPRCSLAEPTTGTTPHDLQRLRSQALAEVAAIEASDSRLHRAIQDQQQYPQSMGVLS